MVNESLPALPVIVLDVVVAMIAVTPVPVLADASSWVTVEPSAAVTVKPLTPVTFTFVAAAEVRVASTFAVVPLDSSVSVSTPGTDNAAEPDTLLITTVAESAEPVTSL